MFKNKIEYKKVTFDIPLSTYELLYDYCKDVCRPRYFMKNIVNLAIIEYCRKKP